MAQIVVVAALLGIAAAFYAPPSVDCQSPPQNGYPFCNTNLTFQERVDDLLSRLTLAEKINQTSTIAPAISRLGINAYNWRSNCLHGWTNGPYLWPPNTFWTTFPNPTGMGATFSYNVTLRAGQITSDEGRALHNINLLQYNGSSAEASGLNCFSPNVNLYRDPLWGRNQETYGEDTFHMAHMALGYTRGIQLGNGTTPSKYLKVGACTKHYAAHDGPDDTREYFTANVSTFDLFDTYLPSTEAQVLGGQVAQLMPAYSSLRSPGSPDGPPDCANSYILVDILRERFGAHNISICSDNGGVAMVYETHHFVDSMEMAAVVSMNATTDLDLGYDLVYTTYLPQAVASGLISEEQINNAVWRSMYLRMTVGDFDPPSLVPYQSIGPDHLNTPENQAANLDTVHKSMVLLKNINNALPLSVSDITSIAIIGPNANNPEGQLSNYAGNPQTIISISQGIQEYLANTSISISVTSGCDGTVCPTTQYISEAVAAAQNVDLVILVMGLDGNVEGEAHDRTALPCNGVLANAYGLPGCQFQLVEAIEATNAKQIIMVLMHGGGVATPSEFVNDRISAILDVFYPGPIGGTGIANTLFGVNNPGGRMPITIYQDNAPLNSMSDYNMTDGIGWTYRYYKGSILVPFGFGLSYTTFEYQDLELSATSISACQSIQVSATLTNTGSVDGDEVVQLYVAAPQTPGYTVPFRMLEGFSRESTTAGASTQISFQLDAWSMSVTDTDGYRVILPGEYQVWLGGHQPVNLTNAALADSTGLLTATFTVLPSSAPIVVGDCPSLPRPCYAC